MHPRDTAAPPTVDPTRWCLCPTVTPLHYTPSHHSLSHDDRLLYNQLTAAMSAEVIAWLEATFRRALHAVCDALGTDGPDASLRDELRRFDADEAEHIEAWHALRDATLAARGLPASLRFLRVPGPIQRGLHAAVARPRTVTAVFWLMLALEEHSIQIAQRTLALPADALDPTHAAAQREHVRDEGRHVRLDEQLIARFSAPASPRRRRANARVFEHLLTGALLRPVRSASRVIDALVDQRPALRPRAAMMKRELAGVHREPAYVAMMYGPDATPLLHRALQADDAYRPVGDRLRARAAGLDAASPSLPGAAP